MATQQGLEALARTGADSVYGYIARSAEAGPDGVWWQTLSFENVPHVCADVYNGVAGVTLFLTDYARLTGTPAAGALARRGLDWCADAGRPLHPDFPDWPDTSLGVGWAGIGLAWLRLAQATGDAAALGRAAAIAADLAAAEPGPHTSFLFGAAGEGLFLLRVGEATRDDRYLAGAERYGAWLARVAVQDRAGAHWPMRVGGPRAWTGFGMGAAGIGYFLLELHRATGAARWSALTRAAAATLAAQAQPDGGGVSWPIYVGGDASAPPHAPAGRRWKWCTGAPGTGLFYARAAAVLGEGAFLETATAAGESTWAHRGEVDGPGQCHGLAGSAGLLLELARLTRAAVWQGRAEVLARQALAARVTTPAGDVWPIDEPGLYSPDFMCGAAGVGHFFLRLAAPAPTRMPLL
jgi:lantibiotic modifying enzyme